MNKNKAKKQNFYDFSLHSSSGLSMPMSAYHGRVVLIINTASRCGWVKQIEDLKLLHERYAEKGLAIIAIPSNDFGRQEPLIACDLDQWFSKNHRAQFAHTDLTRVRGSEQHPLFSWLEQQAGFLGKVRWNYHKFIIDRSGNFAGWFSTITPPSSPRIYRAIERLLSGV